MSSDSPPETRPVAAVTAVPTQVVGPLKLTGPVVEDEVMVPLATYEQPLWPSTQRGSAVTRQAGGIRVAIVNERMTRAILLQAPDAVAAHRLITTIAERRAELDAIVTGSSRFARLIDLHWQLVADLIYLRLEFTTGDASGHNMVTLAADRIMAYLLEHYPELRYGSISANTCTDKKVSAINGILGRGKHAIAETLLPARLVQRYLKTTPERIAQLNQRKNLVGSLLAGSIGSANAHYANMLLAFYLATGQDGANVVEGSQGITLAEVRGDDLYFSTTLPNLIVGTVGNGKGLEFVRQHLALLGCDVPRPPGENARRLAAIAAATVLCGELSLLAAQTNPGELMQAHLRLER
jgi:hydroxymethylglutaryl-CoA reductase (NADPH)